MRVPYELEDEFPLDQLEFEGFQRNEQVNFCRKLERDWVERAVGTIIAAHIKGSRWSVVDGGQRKRVAERKGIDTLPACTHVGLSYAERASLFRTIDHRTKLTAYDEFVAALEAGDSSARALRAVTESHGYVLVGPKGENAPGEIRAVRTVWKILLKYGEETLHRVYDTTARAFPEETLKTDLLGGLGSYLRNKDDQEVRHFQAILSDWSIEELERAVAYEMKNASRGSGGSPDKWVDALRQVEGKRIEPGQFQVVIDIRNRLDL